MAPSTQFFFMRNLVHHKNSNTNAKLLEQQLQRGHETHQVKDIFLNSFGQAVLASGLEGPYSNNPHQLVPLCSQKGFSLTQT
ncbi:unnamed protein product [Arctogadus glacialis]